MSLHAFKTADHVVFQPDPGHVIAFDAWLHEHYRFEPTVKLYLSNYSLLPQAIVGTRRIATIPARLAQQYASTLPIRILKPGFPMPPMIEILQWHPVHSDDAGLTWLRATLHEVASVKLQ
jgi:DNA-binding transcriptional LysR family regulator